MKIEWDKKKLKEKIDELREKRKHYFNQKKHPNLGIAIQKLNHQIQFFENQMIFFEFYEKLENPYVLDLHGFTMNQSNYILTMFFDYCNNIPKSMEIITGKGTYRLYNWLEKNLTYILEDFGYKNYNLTFDNNFGKCTIIFNQSFGKTK